MLRFDALRISSKTTKPENVDTKIGRQLYQEMMAETEGPQF